METITAYYDYLCPFAYRGMEIAEIVAKPLNLNFNWQHYSLYQGNHQENDNWKLWQDKLKTNEKDGGKGLLPFLASYAAKKQGENDTFRLNLARAFHKEGRPYSLETILEIARASNLDMTTFETELSNPKHREALERDHNAAITNQVFATPSFAFGDNLAYFKITELPETNQEAIDLFNDYKTLLERYPYLQNVRRPHVIQKPIK